MFCQTSPSFLAAVPSSIVVLLAKKNGSEAAAALADSSRGCAQCWRLTNFPSGLRGFEKFELFSIFSFFCH